MSDMERLTAERDEAQVDAIMRLVDEAIRWAMTEAALIADQVAAKAEPGHGKKTAGEIGRRIRALMEGHHE